MVASLPEIIAFGDRSGQSVSRRVGIAVENKRILIAGCGGVGQAAGLLLAAQGWQVYGLKRNPETIVSPLRPIKADLCDSDSLASLAGESFSYVLITTSAGQYSEEIYRKVYVEGLGRLLDVLAGQPPARILLASSTSVYHQNDGSWVDEASPVEPAGFGGRVMLEAEALLAGSGMAGTAVRFGGIYGPGRLRLISQLRAGLMPTAGENQISNRIHSADCAGVLAHLIGLDQCGEVLASCYLAVDSAPTPLPEVYGFLLAEMGLDVNAMKPGRVTARGGSKRCSNRRLLDSGYRFLYPDYRAGFRAILGAS